MKKFPFLSLRQSLLALRIMVSLVFFLHALFRLVIKGSFDTFSAYLNARGFVFGSAIVGSITVFEIAGSVAMAMGYCTQYLAAGFTGMLLAGIVIIHAGLGWFTGEHGTGGCEYSVVLIFALLVIAADKRIRFEG